MGDQDIKLSSGEEKVLEAQMIQKSFKNGPNDVDVLDGIDLSVKRGEVVAVLGASGVGKSTLLHILGALDRPTRGQVLIDSINVFTLTNDQMAEFRNQSLGFVFQFHHLLSEFTAIENVMMPLLIGGHERKEAYDTAEKILGEVGLEHRLEHKPGELSGGEQQRVAVARALVRRPRVVLADEPSGNLDRETGQGLLDMIWNLSRTHQLAFVVVTHDETISRWADRMVRIKDGKLDDICQKVTV